jgi:sugar/nucleoside kinase (ribokinase family)
MTLPCFDVLGLGCVAIDDLLYVPGYPVPDTKVQVRRRERQCGGLTATALVAASRLGSRCAYAGVLGDEPLSQFVMDHLQKEGVDTSYVRIREGARPIHSIIVVDESRLTRTILYDLEGVYGAEADWPEESVIRSTRVLYVDHFGIEGMIRAVRIARSAGIPVVADFERGEMPGFSDLMEPVDHLIVSQAFAQWLTGISNPAVAAAKLWHPGRAAVIVTQGECGCWCAAGPSKTTHYPAFQVEAVDTTGCGDVFHGAYASALARGLDLPGRIRFASATAALKATHRGGQAGIPGREQVEPFLEKAGF